MKIVVLGGGGVGYSTARELTMEGHDVTVVDTNRERMENLSAMLDVMTVHGNGAAMDVQRLSGVPESDLLVAVTSSDETNILACILARKLGCKNTIARIRNAQYTEEVYLLRKELGLSMSVNPDYSAAQEAFRLLQFPGFLKREVFVKSRAELVTIRLQKDSPLCGKMMKELPQLLHQRIIVCTVSRGNDVVIPDGSFRLEAEDEISVTAPAAELPKLMEKLGVHAQKAHTVMILGGNRMSALLAEMLIRSGVRVKLVERDPAVCEELAERLPEVSVLCDDPSSQASLNSQNIARMDAVISMMEHDEENLFGSMYARMMGVPQTVTKINREEFFEVCHHCGIERVVNAKKTCALELTRYVRAMQNTNEEGILSVYSLAGEKAEALEFEITEELPQLGIPLAQISLKKNILLACITRGREVIYPGGGDLLLKGDTVIVITDRAKRLVKLQDIFAGE